MNWDGGALLLLWLNTLEQVFIAFHQIDPADIPVAEQNCSLLSSRSGITLPSINGSSDSRSTIFSGPSLCLMVILCHSNGHDRLLFWMRALLSICVPSVVVAGITHVSYINLVWMVKWMWSSLLHQEMAPRSRCSFMVACVWSDCIDRICYSMSLCHELHASCR